MTLTEAQMEKMLEEAPRKKVGEVDFACANCGRMLHRAIWETAWEIDEDGTLSYEGPQATAKCRCGAFNLVAWQSDGESELYWINKKEMQVAPKR